MKRRIFIKNGLFGLSAVFLSPALSSGQDFTPYPYNSLREAFGAIGFDPHQQGSAYFVVTADVHYGSDGDGMWVTIDEVNQMDPLPAFFCVNGDLIMSGSRSFGHIPDEKERVMAKNQFIDFKANADKLNKGIPLMLTLGNHDTHPKEIDPDMFWEVFPGYPPYQSLDLEGVHIIFLNGHSTGYIDPVQEKWLRNDVANISREKNIIIFVHQPSMSHRVRERGIPEAISKIFNTTRGEIWLIGGHEHTNDQKIFSLKNTMLVEHHITCGTINIWGGPEKPGYWVYCLKNGQVFGRIYKQRSEGYRVAPTPNLKEFQEVPYPFDHIDHAILWKTMIGEGDREYLVKSNAADCLNYWAYVKELIYRVPLAIKKTKGKRIGLLTDLKIENIYKKGQYYLSADLNNWEEIAVQSASFEVLIFEIPEHFQNAANVCFKFVPAGEAAVAGWVLLA